MILVQTIGVFAALMSVIGVVLAASKAKRPLLRALGSAVCGAAPLSHSLPHCTFLKSAR